ncbi:MAG: 30S ribosomal protein S4 [Verrucomicrobiales bacterium]|nr:30S ribosomal protein S4 [Verrucomicrobiota bacterium JB025]
MARYTGPRTKISRRFGVALFGPSKALDRRNFPPGQHGVRAGRKKKSEYSVALGEKQKLRFQYGVLEKQFRAYYEEAASRRGVTGEIMLQLLETRLDNVVYRAGFANTRQAARQMVNHGHVLVNGHKVDIASFQVKPGHVIKVGGKPSSQQLALRMVDLTQAMADVEWLEIDKEKLEATMSRVPERSDIDPVVNEQLIVELYSR